MKLIAALCGFFFTLSVLRGADWPAAIEQYEAIAVRQPGRSAALQQVWQYAVATQRMDELKARWEERAAAPEGVSHRLLSGLLAELEGESEAALAHYGRAAEVAPQSALVWHLRGRCEAARKMPEALASLEKAAELEFADERVGTAVEGLIEVHLAAGRLSAARAVLDRAVPAVQEPAVWLRLTRKRAEVARDGGKLTALITALEAAPAVGGPGGSELFQVYQALGDYEQARLEIARARAQRPADSLLREQALALCRAAWLPSELARLRREETRQAPSPEAWRGLFDVLVDNRSADEARALLAAQGKALLPAPMEWRSQLGKFWELGLAKPLADLLVSEAATGAWEGTLLRAELLIAEEDRSSAEEALWSLFDARYESRPLSAQTLASAGQPVSGVSLAAIPGAHLLDRRYRLGALLSNGPHVFNPEVTAASYRVYRVETLQDARDLALLYLAALAADSQRAPQFLARLETVAATWPRSERVLAWAIAENPPALIREIAAAAGEPRELPLDRLCQSLVPDLARLSLEPSLQAQAAALTARFPAPGASSERPARWARVDQGLRGSHVAFLRGGMDEAGRLFAEAAEADRAGPPNDLTTYGMSLATSLRNFRRDVPKLVAGAALAVRATRSRPGKTRLLRLDEGSRALWPTQRPALSYSTYQSSSGSPINVEQLPEALRAKLIYPPECLFTWEQSGVLWTVFGETRQPEAWPLLKKKLDAEIAEVPPGQALLARVAAAYFAWWNGEAGDAISRLRQLLAETGDPGVCIGLAAMLRHQEPPVAADQVLAEMPRPYPAYERIIGYWRLRLAAERRDAPAATALARALETTAGKVGQWRELLPVLEGAGCTEAAAMVRARLVADSAGAEEAAEVSAALRDLAGAGARREALDLAKKVLASSTIPRRTQSSRTAVRREALEILQRFGEREAYLAPVQKAAEASPESLELRVRLAEAASGADAVAAWRRVVALQPANRQAVREMFDAAPSDSAERREALEKSLELEPDALLYRQGDLLFSSYEKAGELPRLAEAIFRAPFRPAAGWRTRSDSGRWLSFVQRFESARLPAPALLVLRKADAIYAPAPASIQRRLIEQLTALNRREEAGRVLLDYLAPAEAAQTALFRLRTMQEASREQATIDPALLKMARNLGVLPELRGRMETASGRDPAAGIVWVFLRVAEREPSALPEVLALLPTLTPRAADTTWVLPLAAELAAWPEAVETSRQLLVAYSRVLEDETQPPAFARRLDVAWLLAQTGGKAEAAKLARVTLETARKNPALTEHRWAPRVTAEIGLNTGDAVLLADSCRRMVELIGAQKESGNRVDEIGFLHFAGVLLDAGRAKEGGEILAALRASVAGQNNSSFARRLEAFEMDARLRRGDWRLATPIVWLDADRTTPEQATLVWDLGLLSRASGTGPQPLLRGEPMPSLDGRLRVELFVGEDAESMQAVARLTEVGARGVWQGRLPVANGFARAVISQGDQVLFGEPLVFCATRNLFREDEAGKSVPSLSAGKVTSVKGGPAIEGEYISFRPADPSAGNSTPLAVGPRARVKPGRDYLLGGWVRPIGHRSARLGWRCLDREGKTVGNGQISINTAGERFWTRSTQRLNWPRNDGDGGQRLPTTTAFIEPVIEGGGAFDLAGLSLVELPAPPPTSEP